MNPARRQPVISWRSFLRFTAAWLLLLLHGVAAETDFVRVAAIFQKHCLDCHSNPDPEGRFLMESFSSLLQGGENGAALVPGRSRESLLVKMIEGTFEKEGKRKIMPPGKREKLSPEEIAFVKRWIDAGAKAASANELIAKEISVPKIVPQVPPLRSIYSLAYEPKPKLLALGRMGEVELVSSETQTVLRRFSGPQGSVNGLVFLPGGARLLAAGGPAGLRGEIMAWNLADGAEVLAISGHTDSIYALAISPDGQLLATGSYDQKIKIWNTESGVEVRTLTGHNGCIYGLAFRPDGKILASASGDRTIKLWDVATGLRRDTLAQPLKDQYTVVFSPDGRRLAAAGVDNRIRIWEVSDDARETTNPILHSKFAHESSILRLAFSPDGKTLASSGEDRLVKLWEAAAMQELRTFDLQPEWAPALAFVLAGQGLAVGRMDGSLGFYDTQTGSILRPPRPEVTQFEPRGIQRGTRSKIKVLGKNLGSVTGVRFSDSRIAAGILREAGDLWLEVVAAPGLPRGAYELVLTGSNEPGAPAKLHVDDLPQLAEVESHLPVVLESLPVSVWGSHRASGDKDVYEFSASPGETLVFDAAAKSLGSKADLLLTLTDQAGKVLESNSRFDRSGDPLIAYRFARSGQYRLIVSELVLAGSSDHFYRLSIGSFPFVTGVYPPVIPKAQSTGVQLIGFNLPGDARRVSVPAADQPEYPIKLDPETYRWREELKVKVSDLPITLETEPNDRAAQAVGFPAPGVAVGCIAPGDQEDWFRFEAKAGQLWILETFADRAGSPLDSKIEVCDAEGKPIVRTLLQAVRASAVTFRGIDSATVDCRVENWEEMELNQFLYLQGEVVRLFRAPQGPDSGFNFYSRNGKRRNYFDTTASAHANAEPCYIVEAHRPGDKLAANGLPTFSVYFENDDDSERKLAADSKVYFTAPRDGTYCIRVADTRGFSGDRFIYTLNIREARPDFRISIDGMNPSVARGSGQRFAFNAERIDGFEGEIKIEASGVPPGFAVSSPLTIQEGHATAFATIFASTNAASPAQDFKFVATAIINGTVVTHDAGSLGKVALSESAPLYVELEPREITLAPGETVPAVIKVHRAGHSDLVTFQVENLPHGIIVDNIGLNGVLIPKDQSEREVFITAAKWVPDTDRLCYAISNEGGRQTSRPVLVKVRKSAGHVASK